jgi:NADPH-ferrihemoprotein reductase
MSYERGHHLAVCPSNPSSEADRLIKILGLEVTKDGVVDIVSLEDETSPVPSPGTRQFILRYYLEICGSPHVIPFLSSHNSPLPKQPLKN